LIEVTLLEKHRYETVFFLFRKSGKRHEIRSKQAMKRILIVLFLITGLPSLHAQYELEQMRFQEDSLRYCLDKLRSSQKDADRKIWNKKFKLMLEETLDMKGAFEYPFDSLKSIARIYSPDKVFRLFNWNVENDNGTFTYYGFVMVPGNKTSLFELVDQTPVIHDPEDKTLDNKKWLGALYYDIILSGTTTRKEYTLLGWDGYSRMSQRKIIDVMIIQADKIQFGAPIFMAGPKGGWKKRVVFEFSSKAKMTMKYSVKDQMIIFDHLIPESEMAEGIREFYVPDGSYDGYALVNERWEYRSDVDARRPKDKKDRFWNDPKKTGNN